MARSLIGSSEEKIMIDEKLLSQREGNSGKVIFEFDYFENHQEILNILNCGQAYGDLNEIYSLVRTELKHGDEELSTHIENLFERIKGIAYRDY